MTCQKENVRQSALLQTEQLDAAALQKADKVGLQLDILWKIDSSVPAPGVSLPRSRFALNRWITNVSGLNDNRWSSGAGN